MNNHAINLIRKIISLKKEQIYHNKQFKNKFHSKDLKAEEKRKELAPI